MKSIDNGCYPPYVFVYQRLHTPPPIGGYKTLIYIYVQNRFADVNTTFESWCCLCVDVLTSNCGHLGSYSSFAKMEGLKLVKRDDRCFVNPLLNTPVSENPVCAVF